MYAKTEERFFTKVALFAEMYHYALVAHEKTVIADYAPSAGNFKTIAANILDKLDYSKARQVFQDTKYSFAVLVKSNHLIFLVLSDSSVDADLRFGLLESLEQKWTQKYSTNTSFGAHSKDSEFLPAFQEVFTQFSNPSAEKIRQIKNNLRESQQVMTEKADSIKESANSFNREATSLKRSLCWERYKWYVVAAVIVIVIIVIIIIAVCA